MDEGDFEHSFARIPTEEIKQSIEQLNSVYAKYATYKMILSTTEECQLKNDSGLPDSLTNKIGLLLMPDSNNLQSNGNNEQIFNSLGIDFDLLKLENKLTTFEKNVLVSTITKSISKSCSTFENKLRNLETVGLMKYSTRFNTCFVNDSNSLISNSKTGIVKWMNNFYARICEYRSLCDKTDKLLNEIIKYDYKTTEILSDNNPLKESSIEVELSARLFQLKLYKTVLSLDNKSLEALLLLHHHLKKKHSDLKGELNKLQGTLSEYKKLDNTEFPALVKQYTQIQKSIAHWQWLLNELLNKSC